MAVLSTENFIQSMRNRDDRSRDLHTAWKLRSLEIWRWVRREGRLRQWDLVMSLADFIPALEDFVEENWAELS
jgi:hypothetical protein